jgi:ATP-dependent DNA ligase
LGGRGGKRSAGEAILYAFNLLYFDGHDLTRMHLDERRTMLETLLSGETGESDCLKKSKPTVKRCSRVHASMDLKASLPSTATDHIDPAGKATG